MLAILGPQERTIASAFAASPTLASELVEEARAWRSRAEQSDDLSVQSRTLERSHRPGSMVTRSHRRRDVSVAEDRGSLWVLDLHQMSAAVARMLLLRVCR